MLVSELIRQLQSLPKADHKLPVVMEMGQIEDVILLEVKELGKWVKEKNEEGKMEERKVPVRTVVLS